MKSLQIRAYIAIGCACFFLSPATGQEVISRIEPVDVELDPGLSTANYDYANVFDLEHSKVLKLDVNVVVREIVDEGAPKLAVKFDWLDKDGTTVVWTAPKTYDLKDPGPTVITLEYVIPFCPKKVSLHLELTQGAVFAHLKGTFSHVCVPESDAVVPAGILLLAFAAWRRRSL